MKKRKKDAFWHLFTGVMTFTNRESFKDNLPKPDSLAQKIAMFAQNSSIYTFLVKCVNIVNSLIGSSSV